MNDAGTTADGPHAFSLRRLRLPTPRSQEVPERYRELLVPSHADAAYHAKDQLAVLPWLDRPLIWFGCAGPYGRMCLDTLNGTVVLNCEHLEALLYVNEDLETFCAFVRVFLSQFPLPGRTMPFSQNPLEDVVDDLRRSMTTDDPWAFAREDYFWPDVLSYVEIGDFND
jgi:hypothetical protein